MIEVIQIQNYKSIQNLDLELKPINIFIGSNGVGKSNFISFFELVRSIYEQKLQSYILEEGIDNLLHFGRKKSDAIIGLLDFDNTNALEFTIQPTKTNAVYLRILNDYFNHTGADDKNYVQWSTEIWDVNVLESSLKKKQGRAYYLKRYLASFKVYHFHDTSTSSSMKIPCNIADNSDLREDGSNLAAFLYYLQLKHKKSFKKIEGVLRSVAPFFDRFDLKPDRINEQQIQLEWHEKNSDMYFNAHNFSDGTLRMLALITLLLQPNPPKTIIIDEPELGLHPSAINKLAALIQSVSLISQVIISTQSVNLVNNFTPEDIVVVDREDNQSVFKRQSSDSLNIWLQEYSIGELWEKNRIGGQP